MVTPAGAWDIIRRLPPMISAVGVFVDWPAEVVAAMARALRLSAVQLHGSEPVDEVRELSATFQVIKAFAVRPGFRVATLKKYSAASAFLLDGFKAGMHGGTGRAIDWGVARQANRYGRVILAGGLTPENAARAIAEAQPFAVDIASGVEARPRKEGCSRAARADARGRIRESIAGRGRCGVRCRRRRRSNWRPQSRGCGHGLGQRRRRCRVERRARFIAAK